ncbi:MAG TPA: hypothetical protein VHK67_04535 [Rhabdochlamydiaceae bacterium]|jgi:hypothetical protein|nr:hypothetical protein [Rhabdochlamydiaceae bacterium]
MAIMATATGTVQYPVYLGALSPYIENKKVRYSLYTAGVLAVAAAAMNYGNITVGITLASAGCLVEGYQIVRLAQEVNNDTTAQEARHKKILQITAHVFTLGIIWGLVMNGLNLSFLYKEGALLLNLDFQLTPDQIPYAWLKNAPSLLSHAAAVTRLGAFAIPFATSLISKGDDFFFDKQHRSLFSLPGYRIAGIWANLRGITFSSFLILLIQALNSKDIQSYLRSAMKAVYPFMHILQQAVLDFVAIYRSQRMTLQQIHGWIASFSNPEPNELFPQATSSSTGWGKTKYAVNTLFFYTLNISLMTARLYYHPFPNALCFGLGLITPTSLQTETTIRRTWEIVPDFIGMPLTIKCLYLFEKFSSAVTAVGWKNVPGACLNGLYLAEDFRFYSRRFFQG